MNLEMLYLLKELDNWDEDKPIQVKDLKRMINKSFAKAKAHKKILEENELYAH